MPISLATSKIFVPMLSKKKDFCADSHIGIRRANKPQDPPQQVLSGPVTPSTPFTFTTLYYVFAVTFTSATDAYAFDIWMSPLESSKETTVE
jgi:hypothetical protein